MKLIHPDLPGVVIDVDDNRARNRFASGWVEADPPDDVTPPAPDPDDTVDADD